MIDDETRARLEELHKETNLDKVTDAARRGNYGTGYPHACRCGKKVLKARSIKDTTAGGQRKVTLIWCSQECFDAWVATLRLKPFAQPVYRDGELVAYVVIGKGRVSVEEIEARTEDVHGANPGTPAAG